MNLAEVLELLAGVPEEERAAIAADALAQTRDLVWCPNPGPQTQALWSEADELFYGGQAGGGKSDLLIGAALTGHRNALILRRINDDAKDLARRGREIAGDGHGFNGQDRLLTLGDARIRFAGCQHEDDKERFKGRAHDFYGFDEVSDFTESQFKFITTWNRSAHPGQRCRVICAGNPPTRPEGLWVLRYWAAWLDPKHPRPAKPGELRWYIRGEADEDIEVDGRGPHHAAWSATPLLAKSRSFIPAALADNPELAGTDYAAMLDSLPAELRAAYRDGNFQAELKDDLGQLIPTAWITAAQARWRPDGFQQYVMTAMALDPAGGGGDAAELAMRHGGWFAPLVSTKGPQTADGSYMAALVVQHRRHACPVVIDAGGGYGGAVTLRLKDNGLEARAFNGAERATGRTADAAKLGFFNKRAEAAWRLREALDPDQEGGSAICLPPDDELKADLAALRWELSQTGIKLESKDDIRKRIGRSPGKGDAVIMALAEGDRAVRRTRATRPGTSRPTTANMGYAKLRKAR